jgi:hypothetical protein
MRIVIIKTQWAYKKSLQGFVLQAQFDIREGKKWLWKD